MKGLLMLILVLGLVGCSSTKKEELSPEREHEDIARDYVVTDSSSNVRPGWIENAELWAKEHGNDIEKSRYFSFETEPKVSRQISCDLAKANAKADIAGEIATFIDKSLATSTEGAAAIDENNPKTEALRNYVENTLAEKIQALIHGAAIVKTYWEKRSYKEDLGAKRDYIAYTCGVLLRIPSKTLADAVKRASDFVEKQADDPETKANVKKALQDASDNFVKAKKGEI